jgi:hypothetical protein
MKVGDKVRLSALILNCKVVAVHSASCYIDDLERITIRIEEGSQGNREFSIVNKDKWKLNDEFLLTGPTTQTRPLKIKKKNSLATKTLNKWRAQLETQFPTHRPFLQ